MAATIVRFEPATETRNRDQRLLELVRDLSGAPSGVAAAAFQQAPPAPAEPLERVAHALVRLRHSGGLRIAAYVPEVRPPAGRAADIVAFPTLPAGPSWRAQVRDQLMRSRTAASTDR
jgi:hypothetical protein